MKAVAARGLSFRHGAREVLSGLELDLEPGGRLAVLGASGAGKTTLLRLLAGLEAPSAGELALWGAPASAPGRVLLPPEQRGVGLVFQELALWPHLDVAGTLAYVCRGTRAERRARAKQLAERVGLGQRLDAHPDQLSGGEQQRLALARALGPEPRLLLLDEPFAHLDPSLRRALQGQLLELASERAELTLVSVTHLAEEALALGETLLILDQGRVLEQGAARERVERPTTAGGAALLGLGSLLPLTSSGAAEAGPRCALGPVALAPDSVAGADAVLVRPDQLGLDPEGVSARVCRVDLLPRAPLSWRVELELAGGARVWAELDERPDLNAQLRVAARGALRGLRGA